RAHDRPGCGLDVRLSGPGGRSSTRGSRTQVRQLRPARSLPRRLEATHVTNLAHASTATSLDELVRAARDLATLGLSPGTSGNVSVRVGHRVFLSATGTSMSSLTTADLAELSLDGEHLAGPKPTKEAPLHLAFYRKS